MKPSLKTSADFSRQLATAQTFLLRYRVLIFAVFVGLVYAYVIMQFNHLSTAQPDPVAVTTAEQAKQQTTPHIDPAIVQKIKQLNDNSVSAHALFNQSRQNPFGE